MHLLEEYGWYVPSRARFICPPVHHDVPCFPVHCATPLHGHLVIVTGMARIDTCIIV